MIPDLRTLDRLCPCITAGHTALRTFPSRYDSAFFADAVEGFLDKLNP